MGESKMVRRNHFVEIGTVCCFNYGPNAGKIGVILDIMDSNKVLFDGPEITRGLASLKHLSITPIKCNSLVLAKPRLPSNLWKNKIFKANGTKLLGPKKIVSADTRLNLTDFDRFKVMLLRKEKSRIVGKEF